MKNITKEIENHLNNEIIPFWKSLKDEEFGGFYGYVDYGLAINKKYEKGCILNSRILWFFSNVYITTGDKSVINYAKQAYNFMVNHCIDYDNGGVYWAVDYKGDLSNGTKYTYNQAFSVYALSSYYNATKDEKALNLALDIFNLIEEKCLDTNGYKEAFDIEFRPIKNEELSENGVIAERTMNTLLHLFEAYTELYKVTKNEKVGQQIKFILDIFANNVYNSELGRQEVFFDENWNSIIDLYSYGHDIETTWLIDLGVDILDDDEYREKMAPITKTITEKIYEIAYRDKSVIYEAENGVENTNRIWWVQAEAMVGFLNAYEKDNKDIKYYDAFVDIWEYIQENVIDPRENSEWFSELCENKKPIKEPIVQPWKCPYHNGRMCLEVIRRAKNA